MSLENSQESVPAIIRVRRKRTAPPTSGWTLSSKRNRMDDGCSIGDEEQQMVFKLAATAPDPSISNVTDLALPSKIALVEYDMENGIVVKKGIVDEEQEKAEAVVDMVEKMDVSDSSRKNEAPLASNESLSDNTADQQWVYDFYYGPKMSSFSAVQIDLNQEISIRQATDEELQLMFMDDDDDDSNAFQDDDADSNAENNPNNDYPDEGEFNEYHETTSEDSYDHYGDEEDVYNDYLDDEGEDDNDY